MILKIIIPVFLGFLIGLEREWHGKSVGIKTISLVTLGSTLFVLMSPTFGDNSRIVAQDIVRNLLKRYFFPYFVSPD